jgi:hypothetical protein
MRIDKTLNCPAKYALLNLNSGEILYCDTLRPIYEAMVYNYRSGYWTATDDVVSNHFDLIRGYNNLMAHS